MRNDQVPAIEGRPGRMFPESNWFERPDTEPVTPFAEKPSPPNEGKEGRISPHQLFSLFTGEVMRDNTLFVHYHTDFSFLMVASRVLE
jgi:hypothetical protein